MSWNLNRVILIGRLAHDPELKYTPSGAAVVKFSLAVGGRPKSNGEETVSFIYVTVWGKPAERFAEYQKKGNQIAVDGRLEQKSWTNQEGQKRSSTEVIAERIEYLGRSSKNQNEPYSGGESAHGEPGFEPVDFVGPEESDPSF